MTDITTGWTSDVITRLFVRVHHATRMNRHNACDMLRQSKLLPGSALLCTDTRGTIITKYLSQNNSKGRPRWYDILAAEMLTTRQEHTVTEQKS